MANVLMMRYAATRGDNHENEPGRERHEAPGEMRMDGKWNDRRTHYDHPGMYHIEPADPGMRRSDQYPRGEYDGAESRYRGRDGRWKPGTRRNEYSGRMDYIPENRRMPDDDDEDEKGHKYEVEVSPKNVIEWPYGPRDEMPSGDYRTSRQIGFGAMNHMDHGAHENNERMGRGSYEEHPMEFDRDVAEHWVRSMRNEDKAHPVGGKWSSDMLKPLAQKYGIPTDGKKFWEFYAMTNAMYSDYGEVAKKFGITSPEFYACMAKAWMDDKDAEPDKTALYYEHIVKKA